MTIIEQAKNRPEFEIWTITSLKIKILMIKCRLPPKYSNTSSPTNKQTQIESHQSWWN
jgi:hypothetical protein